MAHRTLDDWLASSSDEETPKKKETTPKPKLVRRQQSPQVSQQSPKAAARVQRMQEAEERKRKQEELDRKMADMLGSTVVSAVQSKVEAQQLKAEARSPTPSEEYDDSAANSVRAPHLGLPPTAPPFGGDTPKRMDPGVLRDFGNGPAEEPYGVMVADRGCQTSCTVETQTDPDPHVVHCERCYRGYYGHSPAQHECEALESASWNHNRPMVAGYYSGGSGSRMVGAAPVPYQQSGRPQVRSSAALKQQLSFVQSAVDSIIQKYNLPPPPTVA